MQTASTWRQPHASVFPAFSLASAARASIAGGGCHPEETEPCFEKRPSVSLSRLRSLRQLSPRASRPLAGVTAADMATVMVAGTAMVMLADKELLPASIA